MRSLLAIARREIQAYFLSAMGPVSIVGFLVAVGLFFTIFLLNYSDMSLTAQQSARDAAIMNLAEGLFRPLVSNMTLFLLLLMPAITMRLFAPEYRSGIWDMTASWPVADSTWVLGKWLSALSSAAVLILLASAYFLVVWTLGSPEPGPALIALVGLILLSAALAGWGVLASVLFSQQMVSYFLAFAITFSLFIVGSLERNLPGALGRLCRELSLLSHFERFSRGVLDSRDVLYFLGTATVSLLAAVAVVAGRRLPGRRRWTLWTPTLLGVALTVVIYSIGLYLPWTYDATGNKRYSLAPQTLQVLDALPQLLAEWPEKVREGGPGKLASEGLVSATASAPDHVQVYAFYQRMDPARDQIEVLLKAGRQRTPALQYEVVDPETDLERLYQYGVTVSRTVVIEVGDYYISVLQPDESALTNAIYRMATNTRPLIAQVLGHGEHLPDSQERPGYSGYAQTLALQGYELRSLYLAGLEGVPEDVDVLVLAGPRTDPVEGELEALDAYLAGGGAILALFDPPTPEGWRAWMRNKRVDLTGNVLISVDPGGQKFGVGPRTVVVIEGYGDHEIAAPLRGLRTVFPLAQALAETGEPDPQVRGAILMKTEDLSWAENDPETRFSGQARYNQGVDQPGPLPLAMLLEIGPQVGPESGPESGPIGRLAVFGNSEFLNNANLDLEGNRDLLLNTLGWLSRDETLIQIRGRDPLNQPVVLTPTEKEVFGWGSVLGWPVLAGSLAVGLLLRSRRERSAG